MSVGRHLLELRVLWRALREMEEIGFTESPTTDELRLLYHSHWECLSGDERRLTAEWTSEKQDIPETVNA